MILESIFSSIFGILGSGITSYFKYKYKELEFDHEIQKMDKELEIIKTEGSVAKDIAKTKVEGIVQQGELKAFTKSQNWLNNLFPQVSSEIITNLLNKGKFYSIFACVLIGLFGIVEFFRQGVRIFLTYFLIYLTTQIAYKSYLILQSQGMSLTINQAYTIIQLVIQSIIYLTIMVVSWWFCDRAITKHFINKDK